MSMSQIFRPLCPRGWGRRPSRSPVYAGSLTLLTENIASCSRHTTSSCIKMFVTSRISDLVPALIAFSISYVMVDPSCTRLCGTSGRHHQVIIGGKAQKASQHVYPARRGGSMGISSGLDNLIQPMIHQDISGGNYRLPIDSVLVLSIPLRPDKGQSLSSQRDTQYCFSPPNRFRPPCTLGTRPSALAIHTPSLIK